MNGRVNRREWLLGGASAGLLASSSPASGSIPIRLSLNENAYGPSPSVAPAIAGELGHIHRYVDPEEADTLKRQIAALEAVRPDQVLLGEVLEPLGLHLGARSPGGDVVYSSPGYTALPDAGAPYGLKGKPVPLNDRLENDLPALARAIGARTVALSLVNPHNPSGTVSDPAAFDALITDAARKTLVIVDEAYLEYDPGFAERTAARHVRAGRNVLLFRTLAKIYGLAGLSIGYAIGPADLTARLAATGIGEPHTLNRLSLVAARAALRDQDHVALVRSRTAEQRERLHAVLDRRRLRRTDSHADFIFFQPRNTQALRDTFERAGIEIARPFPPLDGWIRITVGTAPETDRVIEILERA